MTTCDVCDKESVKSDSWFLTESCEEHKHLSPVDRQKHPDYKWERKGMTKPK